MRACSQVAELIRNKELRGEGLDIGPAPQTCRAPHDVRSRKALTTRVSAMIIFSILEFRGRGAPP